MRCAPEKRWGRGKRQKTYATVYYGMHAKPWNSLENQPLNPKPSQKAETLRSKESALGEAREREMTRQLDKFEWKKGTDPKNPEVAALKDGCGYCFFFFCHIF